MARKSPKKSEFPLLDHVETQMVKLLEHAPAALERFDEGGIHQARVATRRLKAAIDLMEPVTSKRYRKPVSDALRRLRRRLGPLRDADVMINHLSDIKKEGKHAAAAVWMRGRLEADRQALRAASQEKSSADRELRRVDRWPNVRAEMAEAKEAADHLLAESLHLQTDAFAEQAGRLVQDLEGLAGAGREAPPPPPTATRPSETSGDVRGGGADGVAANPANATSDGQAVSAKPQPRQNPHDLRIAGKALRYTLEMAEAQGHSPGTGVMKQFKRMQEALGDWHDYVVLADRSLQEVVAAELAHHDAAEAGRVIDLARHAVRRSASDLSGFAKLWRQQGEKLSAKIRAAFPLTQVALPGREASRELGGSAAGPADPGLPAAATPDAITSGGPDAATESGTDPGPAATTGPAGPGAARRGASPAA